MDDSSAGAVVEAWRLNAKGTLHAVMRTPGRGILNKDEARESILQLAEKGFRIEPRLLTRTEGNR
jgi:hypothetical protein